MKTQIELGNTVRKISPKNDYTFGRIGTVCNLDHYKNRVRVRWIKESNGDFIKTCNAKPGNGVRTWVKETSIEIIN